MRSCCTLLDGCGPGCTCLENNACLVHPFPSPVNIPHVCVCVCVAGASARAFLAKPRVGALSCHKCTLRQRLIWPICARVSSSHERTQVEQLKIKIHPLLSFSLSLSIPPLAARPSPCPLPRWMLRGGIPSLSNRRVGPYRQNAATTGGRDISLARSFI